MCRRFSKENFPNILKIVDTVQGIAKKYNATAGQVALAWLLAQGDDIIPIPGTRKVKVRLSFPSWHPTLRFSSAFVRYLEENLGALKLQLTPEDVAAVRQLAEAAESTLGDRCGAAGMKSVLADKPAL